MQGEISRLDLVSGIICTKELLLESNPHSLTAEASPSNGLTHAPYTVTPISSTESRNQRVVLIQELMSETAATISNQMEVSRVINSRHNNKNW